MAGSYSVPRRLRFGDSFTILVYARACYALFKGDTCHTFASQLLANGAPIVNVKEQMGRASIQTTVDIYGHLIQGRIGTKSTAWMTRTSAAQCSRRRRGRLLWG